ncbi:TetR/AcrR family transcriptional regulator [Brevibacterium aurantiacum]|uniref:Transcriptional regulator, TetR family n=1 Tax=Brevibacterium aurantiacum TaxID=273384 RepID=A0A2H1KR83_BREAU|nr:TetR/AcrR family transcriptional regulator [Brevibacterium aurantiacum]SMY02227.1 transcriptional regulator, TetR family [Brevibacterium aurantiacum]
MAENEGTGLPAAGHDDLTSRARIRNAALHQFAVKGFAGTPLRAIATEAGVAIGLIGHYFGSKEGTREAVETWIVGLFASALDRADSTSADTVADVTVRDETVAQMLADNPLVVDYLRRQVLEMPADGMLISRLTSLTMESVEAMRNAEQASANRDRVEQVVTAMVRQLGRLFLQPLVDQIVDSFPEDEQPATHPELRVEIKTAQ